MATQTLHAPQPLRVFAADHRFLRPSRARRRTELGRPETGTTRVLRLQALSDAQLAERGIARDDIVRPRLFPISSQTDGPAARPGTGAVPLSLHAPCPARYP